MRYYDWHHFNILSGGVNSNTQSVEYMKKRFKDSLVLSVYDEWADISLVKDFLKKLGIEPKEEFYGLSMGEETSLRLDPIIGDDEYIFILSKEDGNLFKLMAEEISRYSNQSSDACIAFEG